MVYAGAALIGAACGALGPIFWAIALRRGHHLADGTGILDAIIWIFPCAILFLGFLQAEHRYPHGRRNVELAVGLVNVVVFAMIAVAIVLLWRFFAHD